MHGATWIIRWNESALHWGEAMWRTCWQGGVLALILWCVCQRWPRMPSTLRYGLWWMVCFKLLVGLCPVSLTLPLLPPAPSAVQAHTAVVLPPAIHPISPSLPTPDLGDTFTVTTERGAESAPPRLSGAGWLMGGWLIGVGALAGFSMLSLRRLRRLVRQAVPLSDPALLSLAQETAVAMGLRAAPRILMTQADIGVLTLGGWRPAVLLSQQTLVSCTPSELQLVLAHEFAHIRRGDAWLGFLPHLTQIFFCFYPLAWLACREVALAREAACDEQTICALHARSDLYGRLLLKLGVRHASWLSLCTPGVSSHFRILQRRLSMLQQVQGSPRRLQGRALMVVCLVGVAVTIPWGIVHAQDPAKGSGDAGQAQHTLRNAPPSGSRQAMSDLKAQTGGAKTRTAHE
ncbi:MAG TPA: M56 family metallopeptidase, partial [Chthonomonadaceae bacterium]|nr:M56 family metallopeptidase [Chthonomonadaceae bacterium]